MAQHLDYPATDDSLPDHPPSEHALAPTPAAKDRLTKLRAEFAAAGLRLTFHAVPGVFVVEDQASGRQWESLAKTCLAHVKSGRPKLDSVIRVVTQKVSREVNE